MNKQWLAAFLKFQTELALQRGISIPTKVQAEEEEVLFGLSW